jgi:hypothetical protein
MKKRSRLWMMLWIPIAILLLPVCLLHAADPFPLRVISDPNPNFSGIWVDTVNDEIAVGDDNNHGIVVYNRTANGAALPTRSAPGVGRSRRSSRIDSQPSSMA